MEQSRLLLDLSRTVTASLDLQEVLDKSLGALRKLLDFGGGAIQLIDDGALVAAATDPPATAEARSLRIPLGQGVSGLIATMCEAVYIPDITRDERVHWEGKAKGTSIGVRSYFGAPLILHGEATGVVQIDAPEVDAFSPADRALVLSFLPTIAAAVQNAQLFTRELETIDQLRETERMKDDFLAIASHELRTPLTSLTGFSITLAQKVHALEPGVIAEFADRILRATQQLEHIVSDLLDVARIEHGVLHAEPVPFEVGPLLRDIAATADASHPVEVSVESGLPVAIVDPARLRQILLNLVSNAQNFSPAGAAIRLSARRHGSMIAIGVTDKGTGMAADVLERIFDRFYQVDPALTRRTGGLGVGLYLVRRLCDLMRAKIRVDSTPGEGSTFTVIVPSSR